MKTSIKKGLEHQQKALNYIPGMTQLLSKRPDQFSLGVWPGYYQKAKGAELWDLDGNHFIDMSISGIGANVLGYADPDVDAAVINAIKQGVSSSLNCPEEVELAELLCSIHPWASKVRYTRSGGEAMAMAVRIARAFTKRDKVAFCGYHGWHDWYLSANLESHNDLNEHLLTGLNPAGVPKALRGTALPFRYNEIHELELIFKKNRGKIAAVVMEPMRNIAPQNSFLQKVKSLAKKHGAVLVFDEISAGFRINTGGIHLTFNVEPDIAVFSKALGNGYPIGAVIGRGKVMNASQKTFISSTCWTERTGPAAAIASINKFQRLNAGAYLNDIGTQIQKGWKDLSEKYGVPLETGGLPPLSHFSFKSGHPVKKAFMIQAMLEKGFLSSNIFYAMYAHKKKHVAAYLGALDDVFKRIAEIGSVKEIKKLLHGKPSASGFKRLN